MQKRKTIWPVLSVALLAVASAPSGSVLAAGGEIDIERQDWSFSGPFGTFDRGQLQRGFKIYQNVCAACHGIKRLRFRNLTEAGGPEFKKEEVEELAKGWAHQVDGGFDDDGEPVKRQPRLADAIPGPYENEKQARAAQNGALPPDLSLITEARSTAYTGPLWYHPIHMGKDMLTAYQEGGSDYLYALLTGYKDEPPAYKRIEGGKLKRVGEDEVAGAGEVVRCASITRGHDGEPDKCTKLQEGMYYNAAFPGHQIAMGPPLYDESVEYTKNASGEPVVPETAEQYARDVTAFLTWTADPTHDQRKRIGWFVMIYLLITTLLLYFAKKAIWKRVKH